jgi:two-component system sensor histidine kinase/response regulator
MLSAVPLFKHHDRDQPTAPETHEDVFPREWNPPGEKQPLWMNFHSSHPGLQLKNRKILIVAADRAKVRSLTEILRPEGYFVRDVNSGQATLDIYAEFEPDLIVFDVELPGVHVFEICRYLKNLYGAAAAAVIFIAAQNDPGEVVEGLAAGGVDYLSRPFREAEVAARIRVHLLNRLRLAQANREDKAKNRLLCMAAHDLRNPLVSIRALTNLLRAGAVGSVSPEQRDLLDTVYDASHSMLALVNELLEASVLEAGELKLTMNAASLAGIVDACVRLSNATAAEKGSQIVLEPGPLPECLSLDEPKIRQVLNNLLGNAIKFSPPGSTITVVTARNANQCSVAIRDQGPGIPEGERAKLFKDFSRTSVRPTAGESSTGLGLSICHKIVQAHDGAIGVENLPGGGAEFRVVLPLTA